MLSGDTIMRGLFWDGKGVVFRKDLPVPGIGPDEVRLKVRLAGICDTDIQIARGYMGFRGVLGHEFVGEDESGRRFTAEINNPCRRCPNCQAGRTNHCPHRSVLGILGRDGAMADWVVVPEANLHPIPDALEDRLAVFIEPLAAAFRVAEQVPIEPGMKLAVLGDGKLGILCAWALAMTPAEVHLIGKHPEKLELAGNSIATHLLGDVGGLARSFDLVVDATGSASGLPTALGLVRPLGAIVLKTTVAGPHALAMAPIVIDEVRLIGSRCGPFPTAIDALANGSIDPRPLIEATYPLDHAEEAFQIASRRGARKILLGP